MPKFARVIVDQSGSHAFDYEIPPQLGEKIEVGSRVRVPVRTRLLPATVIELLEESDAKGMRPIAEVIGSKPILSPLLVRLAHWIADYYCCDLEAAMRAVLPQVIRKGDTGFKTQLFVRLAREVDAGELAELERKAVKQWAVVDFLKANPDPVAVAQLLKQIGATHQVISALEKKGVVATTDAPVMRDPHASETFLHAPQLVLNAEQTAAFAEIRKAIEKCSASGGAHAPSRAVSGASPETPNQPAQPQTSSGAIYSKRRLPHFERPWGKYAVTFSTHERRSLNSTERDIVLQSLLHAHEHHQCELYAACVMPDHVHLLFEPQIKETGSQGNPVFWSLTEILQGIKSTTAHQINKARDESGAVWEKESLDRLIRSEADFGEKFHYICRNPWDSGVARQNEEYKWLWTHESGSARAPRAGFGASPKQSSDSDASEKVREGGAPSPAREGACAPQMCAPQTRPILIHGVTGSGKTELYLQAIQLVLDRGQTAIMLVPEISLTPQTVERFKSRFSDAQDTVAVLHSHLSEGERHDEWHKIADGRARMVIGARSAIFAPLENLGLIVVDEEHENSYKQEETPRYHGRDIAVLRGSFEKCAVILGSATPSLESIRNARTGKYQLLKLTQRVDDQKMPLIRVVDMRNEARKGASLISERLRQAMTARLEKKEQTILFLNRRGFSTSLICHVCGYVCECPNCSIALTFHRAADRLVCHICGHRGVTPKKCPECKDPAIRYSGAGTEKVEEAVAKMFPKAVVKRMDADTMTRKEAYRETLGAFRAGKIDILVGTQMIAKGLHFPNVTLVGIVNADLGLHMPDFRAGERTFQLLTQVAGRAGRGEVEGEVFVQSFTPFHPAIQFARHHDCDGFWEQETEFREQWGYPPFTHMVLITIRSEHQTRASFSAETLARRLKDSPPAGVTLSEPAPAPLEKSKGSYRFHVMIRTRTILKTSRWLRRVLEKLTFPEDVIVTVDVDPYHLL